MSTRITQRPPITAGVTSGYFNDGTFHFVEGEGMLFAVEMSPGKPLPDVRLDQGLWRLRLPELDESDRRQVQTMAAMVTV